jgi:conjugative relaxase-like TrwC/TraI family protein
VLSIKTQSNLANAEKYFEEHLQLGDYYSQDKHVRGEWIGDGAQRLGLPNQVSQEDFLKLCHNQNPATGELLTQRMKTTRWDAAKSSEIANRRVFYDFTFSPPKSVSVVAFVADDKRIVESHNRAVKVAVAELEHFAGTRVHNGLHTSERRTGNVICALFRHETSRALDPHLHTHCVIFNATHDAVENRWKALSNFEMLRAQKFAENVYYHELARDLGQYGYEIENSPRGDFQIQGVSKEVCSRFAKRHHDIDERFEKLLREKPELARGNLKEIRAQIAQTERSRKIPGIEFSALKNLWDSQLTDHEKSQLSSVRIPTKPRIQQAAPTKAKEAVDWAEAHLFDRRSVLQERELWSSALERGRGGSFSVAEIKAITQQRTYVRDERLPERLTTLEALQREWEIVCMARDGRGKHNSFNSTYEPVAALVEDQRRAVEAILRSRDFVTLFSGGAGTGKSHTLREIGRGLKTAGLKFQVIAPQRQQVLDLRKTFEQAKTVSEFLTNRELASGSVVIVDEAGQIGGKQMHDLLSFVQANDGRVILSGDTRQHGAVESSDALRAIERFSGLHPARLTKIRRQNPKLGETKLERKRIKQYRAAVRKAQIGRYAESFACLNRLGAIIECRSLDEQREQLVAAYLEIAERNKSTVVVSQTWQEIHEINERIRIGLRSAGLLSKEDFIISALERVDLTNAQKRDERFYRDDAILVFNRDTADFKKGDHAKLLKITPTHLLVEANERIGKVSVKLLDRVTVCRPREMALAEGDRLQLKANFHSVNGRELVNGELVTVAKIDPARRIHLKDGRVLPENYREFIRGYAVTSYGSQGKTVEYVLFSDSAVKAATNNQQWLVSISRGIRGLKIFTQNKEQLEENICRSGDRELAIELAKPPSAKSQSTPHVVRRYVENLIQSRRLAAKQKTEGVVCKQKFNLRMTQNQRRGMRI